MTSTAGGVLLPNDNPVDITATVHEAVTAAVKELTSGGNNSGYEALLAALRKDLQLDPSTDCLPPGLVSAQSLPWKIDGGTMTLTWTSSATSAPVSIPHRLGRIPVSVVFAPQITFIDVAATAVTATSITASGFNTANNAFSASETCYWLAIG